MKRTLTWLYNCTNNQKANNIFSYLFGKAPVYLCQIPEETSTATTKTHLGRKRVAQRHGRGRGHTAILPRAPRIAWPCPGWGRQWPCSAPSARGSSQHSSTWPLTPQRATPLSSSLFTVVYASTGMFRNVRTLHSVTFLWHYTVSPEPRTVIWPWLLEFHGCHLHAKYTWWKYPFIRVDAWQCDHKLNHGNGTAM